MTRRPVTPHDAARADAIAQAHARSRALGLRATEAPEFDALAAADLRELIDTNRTLYHQARPVMDVLHAQIVDTQSMVLLTDRNGVILHSFADSDFVEKAHRVALRPGVSWAEQHRGTNAIGTALVEGQPTTVHAGEHFLRANHILTCSCAPIADPYGRTLGALDVSGESRGFHKHTLALVRMSAQMIENHLFNTEFAEAIRLQFHARAEFIGTLYEGLAAFSADGTLLCANRSALFQFGAPLAELQQREFAALFGQPFTAFMQQLMRASGEPLTLTLPSGVRVIARATPGAATSGVATSGVATFARTAVPETSRSPYTPAPAQAKAPNATDTTPQPTLAELDTGDERLAAALQRVARVRGRDIPVLVLGRTGTGKEWLARALHRDSPRRDGPFVALNCAALPDTLIEAELFGYEEGAFTGAKRRGSAGKIAQAHGGTLFLDEIGDMPLAQQVRLMRVLQERAVVPLGGTRAVPVDLRIVCATHRDLRAMIAEGTFREDLYYRINGLVVTLPALAERTDLDALVARMLELVRREVPGAPARLTPAVRACFARCRWPGNLRQLASVLRTAAIMAEGEDAIDMEHLPEDLMHDCDPASECAEQSAGATAEDQTGDTEHEPARLSVWQSRLIEETLARHSGNVSAAARELGLARNTVYRHLRQRR
ncbi:sigma-54-dependent Fis family transcriptional regulator [Paraburkholderia sp. CNPSo 3274]|uniref:sigma-54-dependent Fis family transcriptional regulator n=1 Tax=Paraburkholderia sp. CNPSo 3274 TaxID=2940932 RepID=UPI0020B85E30|nr:sigma-54-dependent Fis family transcriptional regulator [Paraburkholderia sp. CNPSo 3274]MCP3708397.1 sigma-54-dependent Fis family transcriptional regulator [Paraburkholderia sp. CNPSo 3274]